MIVILFSYQLYYLPLLSCLNKLSFLCFLLHLSSLSYFPSLLSYLSSYLLDLDVAWTPVVDVVDVDVPAMVLLVLVLTLGLIPVVLILGLGLVAAVVDVDHDSVVDLHHGCEGGVVVHVPNDVAVLVGVPVLVAVAAPALDRAAILVANEVSGVVDSRASCRRALLDIDVDVAAWSVVQLEVGIVQHHHVVLSLLEQVHVVLVLLLLDRLRRRVLGPVIFERNVLLFLPLLLCIIIIFFLFFLLFLAFSIIPLLSLSIFPLLP